MNQKLTVSPSPHLMTSRGTRAIMLDVIIALAPTAIASAVIFGPRTLAVIALTVFSSVLAEYLFNLILKRPCTVGDCSAAVTGLILALNLPSEIPLWLCVLGAVIAIVAVKGLFGGLGQNFANPALTARIVLFLSFSKAMSAVGTPNFTDAVSSATPLSAPESELPSLLDMFLGLRGGMLGETCAVTLILGGIYLIIRKVITWHTPVAFIGTLFLLSLAVGENPFYAVLSGGLLLGAIYMATDYVTTPITWGGRLIFGAGCGLITFLIRTFGSYPEGVSFAILFMSLLTPYIDELTRPHPVGSPRRRDPFKKRTGGESKKAGG